jgi:hypothetical protein
MFNDFEYFSTIYAAAGLVKIFKASGISVVEDLLKSFSNTPDNCLIVRDSGDGNLNFRDRQLDTAYHTIYIFAKGKLNDPAANMAAKRDAMSKAIALFKLMKLDAGDFGDSAYGFDDSKVDYSEIGPIGQQMYGYSFSFLMEHAF